jgi:hypothetical protein
MPFLSRVVDWFERVFDMSENDEGLEPDASEGFLMNAPGQEPPVLPEFQAQRKPARVIPFRVALATPEPELPEEPVPAPQVAEEDEPLASSESAADAPKIVRLSNVEEEAAAFAVREQPPADEDAVEADDATAVMIAPTEPSAPAEAISVPGSVPTEAPEPTVVEASSGDDMLAMFQEAGAPSEYREFLQDMEDVSAKDLLEEARAIRDLLPPAGAGAPEAA